LHQNLQYASTDMRLSDGRRNLSLTPQRPAPQQRSESSLLGWLNHNSLKLVLEDDHSTVVKLHCLVGRARSGCVRWESSREAINVLGAAPLDERPFDFRNLSGKAAAHLAC